IQLVPGHASVAEGPERYREGALAKAREFSAGQWATRLVDVYRYAIEAKAGRANDKAFLKR
ncbi:MAG TPA: hypothetical protein PLJ11_02555, partial [Methanomassiliicoccales archaeon]|nr:hypothetical protein [Methanomassiliicoccales archaeon]